MSTQASSAPSACNKRRASAAEKKSRKEHNARMWTWLKQVNRDRNLPPSKTAVAVVLADHSNYAKPDTWPSAATIAEESGLAESSVTETLAKLAAGGHLETTPGKKGRGHSSRHKLIVKPRPAGISTAKKITGFAIVKPRPAVMNLYKNLYSAAHAARTVPVDRDDPELIDLEPAGERA